MKIAIMDKTQCKMARVALGWHVADLAALSGIAINKIIALEAGRPVSQEIQARIKTILEAAGAQFFICDKRVGVTVLA